MKVFCQDFLVAKRGTTEFLLGYLVAWSILEPGLSQIQM
jgi:hypothetical protein